VGEGGEATRPVICVAMAAMLLSACTTKPLLAQGEDACGASQFQSLVGLPNDQIPTTLPSPARVVADDQAVTMDYNPDRLNIVWNHETRMVESVRCG